MKKLAAKAKIKPIETNAGRMGRAETLSVTLLSLLSAGLFSRFSETSSGRFFSFLTRPAAILLSLLPVLIAALSLRSQSKGLGAKLRRGLRAFAPFAALPLAVSLVFAAALPLCEFTSFIRSFVFDGVPALSVLAFTLPVIACAALFGLEPAGRASRIVLPLALIALALAIVPAAPEFDPQRLGSFDLPSAAQSIFSDIRLFLPVLCALLINSGAADRPKHNGKNLACSAVVSAPHVLLALLSVGLVYPAKLLQGMTLPLARLNFLSVRQSYAMRLDKALVMVWLAGSMLSAAYCLYSAARLTASSLGTPIYGPFSLLYSFAAGALVLLSEKTEGAGEAVFRLYESFGFALPLPALLCALIPEKTPKGLKKINEAD